MKSAIPNKFKSVAIIQSNYIPWKGYFDIINAVDTFVIFDDCQYTRRDWRNRNKIKTSQGVSWITVPVRNKGNFSTTINNIEIDGTSWIDKHLSTIKHQYAKAPAFHSMWPIIHELYESCRNDVLLSDVNYRFIKAICDLLHIKTQFFWSHDLGINKTDPSERLVAICESVGANIYLSGPAARDYLDEEIFQRQGINVVWMRYDNYPEYTQLHQSFCHHVSVIDLLLCVGYERARDYVCLHSINNDFVTAD